ncbi:hypothetical protein ACIRQQ_33070 [Streptomyces fuscichromogenes]|uniref:hypothetical protein n=1 Tax=Streptomyces fuscichromogenes TaxID=1324013 RepID=UPI0037FE4DE9
MSQDLGTAVRTVGRTEVVHGAVQGVSGGSRRCRGLWQARLPHQIPLGPAGERRLPRPT